MITFELPGKITESGQLEIQLPAGLPVGDVIVRIDVPDTGIEHDDQIWTEEEMRELMKLMTPTPKTGAEIAEWLKNNPPADADWGDITNNNDVAEYVHNMRRANRLYISANNG